VLHMADGEEVGGRRKRVWSWYKMASGVDARERTGMEFH